jgi:hypothetical protein
MLPERLGTKAVVLVGRSSTTPPQQYYMKIEGVNPISGGSEFILDFIYGVGDVRRCTWL